MVLPESFLTGWGSLGAYGGLLYSGWSLGSGRVPGCLHEPCSVTDNLGSFQIIKTSQQMPNRERKRNPILIHLNFSRLMDKNKWKWVVV